MVLVLVLRPRVLVLVFVLTKKSYLHHCNLSVDCSERQRVRTVLLV